MELRTLRRLAVSLAAAVFLAAAGDCYGEGAAGRTDGPDASGVSENASDPSDVPGGEVAQDNAVAASPVPLAEATEDPAAAAAGEEADLREPSFEEESPPVAVADPIEPVNRGIFYVNDKLYRWVFRP
ncbi:MAG: MlaA lipoprotein, partial [Deltaproteobacteria bacterium]|nr:MlaA lipoprotein [Deltaproteobacteria bacterium]